MTNGDDGVGDRGAKVRPHDHGHSGLERQCGAPRLAHEANDGRGCGTRTLNQYSGQYTHGYSGEWVGYSREKVRCRISTEHFDRRTHQANRHQEEVDQSHNGTHTQELLGSGDT